MRSVTPNPVVGDAYSVQEVLRDHAEAINQAAAGQLFPTANATATYIARPSEQVILAAPSAPMTVTLPSAASTRGALLIVKRTNTTTHTITVQASSGNIDGSASTALTTSLQAVRLISDGSNYWTV